MQASPVRLRSAAALTAQLFACLAAFLFTEGLSWDEK
jgi:hypothetical protein